MLDHTNLIDDAALHSSGNLIQAEKIFQDDYSSMKNQPDSYFERIYDKQIDYFQVFRADDRSVNRTPKEAVDIVQKHSNLTSAGDLSDKLTYFEPRLSYRIDLTIFESRLACCGEEPLGNF